MVRVFRRLSTAQNSTKMSYQAGNSPYEQTGGRELDSCFQKTPLIFPALVVRKTSSGNNNVRDNHDKWSSISLATQESLALTPESQTKHRYWLMSQRGRCAVALLLEASRESRTGVGITVTGRLGCRLENSRTPAAKNTSTHRFQGVKPLLRHASHWNR